MMATPSINYELAVETVPPAQFAQFLTDHPEVINKSFWHGQTALHKVCLRQDSTIELLEVLITAGANVNAVNNYGETPLMFSAKRGSSTYCELLLKNGADMTACDKAGRHLMHHAIMGGSIYLVHYLRLVYDCGIDFTDARLQTPLHIASSQGNLAMVDYLLKSDVVDCKKADSFGNTAIHHAAIYGHDQVVFSLLRHTGLSLLDIRNGKGQTAIEVGVGKGSKHLYTDQLLKYAYSLKSQGCTTLQRPTGLLRWYLLMPLVFFLAGQLLSHLLQMFIGGYSGAIFMSIVIGYILYLYQVHNHRIKHPTRWPNPMYAGAFGYGIFGTLITWLVVVFPQLNLMNDSVNIVLCAIALVLMPPSLIFYRRLLVSDPGFAPIPNKDLLTSSASKLAMKSMEATEKFCVYCTAIHTGNVKYCKLCERCVIHMDHHCLFLMRCVATNNHRLFTIFIILINIDILLFLVITCRHYYQLYYDQPMVDILSLMATGHILIFFVILLNIVSSFWGVFLIQWQLRLISQGFTYYETVNHTALAKNDTSLSRRDRCLNLYRFFKGNKTPHRRAAGVV